MSQNRLKAFIFLCAICCLVQPNYAQTLKAYEKAADKALAEKDYYSAMIYLAEALEISPDKVSLQFKYAEVARQFNAYEAAEAYLKKVAASEEASKFPMTNFWLAMVQKSQGKYAEAKRLFKDFSETQNDNNYYAKWARAEVKACDEALVARPPEGIEIKVKHLDKKVNTTYSEIGALPRGDTLYYASYRYEFQGDQHNPPRRLTKVLTSKKGAKGRPLTRGFNDPKKLTAHTAFSKNGKRIYFTLCNYVSSANIQCAIYYREKDKRKRWKKTPVKLPDFVNAKGFTTTHPAIAFDSVAGKEVLYFVSDRPKGKGKLDIWKTEVDGKKFSEPQNVEILNTPENDITPFFHQASKTLYFSSDGHLGMGGYDVFKIKKDPDWGNIENVGVPVNTSYHDLYYALDQASKTAYLSSNRPGSFYLDKSNKACCYDIFQVQYRKPKPVEPTAEEPPITELPEPLPPPEPTLPPVPTTLEDFLPLALYFDNDEPDKRTRRTTTKKSYPDTYEKYYRKKREYITEFIKPLSEDDSFDGERIVEDFFEDEVRKGYEHLYLFSDILLKRLENGENVEIFIKGYTSPRAKGDYNLALGKRRVSSLRNHFQTYQNGIFTTYLSANKLVISEVSFGETQAATAVSDELNDLRGSIYHPAAARERRVEIVEVKGEEED